MDNLQVFVDCFLYILVISYSLSLHYNVLSIDCPNAADAIDCWLCVIAIDEADLDDIEGLRGEQDELEQLIASRNKKIAGYKESRSWTIDNICKVKEERR